MNIYKLIAPVNKYNYVNHPYIKRDLDYYSQHSNETNTDDEFAFMKRKKLSTNIHGMKYSDDYIKTKINVISNAMKVDINDRTPISKRVPEVMQNPYIPFGDPNTKYDELLTASPTMLASVEPINYFGCRIVGDYLYNFDIGMIFKIIPKDFLARFVDPTLIKENTIYVDSRSAMLMSNKSAFKNIWTDTKRYIPIHPKYVETIDIVSLIEQSNKLIQSQQPIREPVIPPVEPVREPVIAEPPIVPVRREETPYETYSSIRDYDEQQYQQQQEKKAIDDIFKKMQPVVESDSSVPNDSSVLEQQQQRKRRILDESLNEQQQQQPRRRRKPKMNETTK